MTESVSKEVVDSSAINYMLHKDPTKFLKRPSQARKEIIKGFGSRIDDLADGLQFGPWQIPLGKCFCFG